MRILLFSLVAIVTLAQSASAQVMALETRLERGDPPQVWQVQRVMILEDNRVVLEEEGVFGVTRRDIRLSVEGERARIESAAREVRPSLRVAPVYEVVDPPRVVWLVWVDDIQLRRQYPL